MTQSFGILTVLIVGRIFWNMIYPVLYVEDNSLYFNFYYYKRHFLSVFRTPVGYHSIITEIVAWAVSYAKVTWLPYLYMTFALLATMLTCILSDRLTQFHRKDFIVFAPVVLGLIGLNHSFYYITLTYTIWSFAICFLILLYSEPPRKNLLFVLYCLWMILLSWSHPYCILGIPLSLFLLLDTKNIKKWIVLLLMAGSSVVYISTLATTSHFDQVFVNIADYYFSSLLKDVVLLHFIKTPHVFVMWLVVCSVAVCGYAYKEDHNFLKKILYIVLVILLSHMLYFVSDRFSHGVVPSIRYLVIPQFFWVMLVLVILEKIFKELGIGIRGTTLLWVVIVALVLSYNVKNGSSFFLKKDMNYQRYMNAVSFFENMEWGGEYIILSLEPYPYHPHIFAPKVTIGEVKKGARQLVKSDFPNSPYLEFIEDDR